MSRSGYSDEEDYPGQHGLWRTAVARAINGKRGQRLLRDIRAGLDALPDPKRLISGALVTEAGEVCALGAAGVVRGLVMPVGETEWDAEVNVEEPGHMAKLFDIAYALAAEVAYVNDEDWDNQYETPEERYVRVGKWVDDNLRAAQ